MSQLIPSQPLYRISDRRVHCLLHTSYSSSFFFLFTSQAISRHGHWFSKKSKQKHYKRPSLLVREKGWRDFLRGLEGSHSSVLWPASAQSCERPWNALTIAFMFVTYFRRPLLASSGVLDRKDQNARQFWGACCSVTNNHTFTEHTVMFRTNSLHHLTGFSLSPTHARTQAHTLRSMRMTLPFPVSNVLWLSLGTVFHDDQHFAWKVTAYQWPFNKINLSLRGFQSVPGVRDMGARLRGE